VQPATLELEDMRPNDEWLEIESRDQVIEEYMPLVRSLARRFAGRGEQFEDLVQVGAIGLIKATDRYDPSRGVEFASYAVPTIIGEIKRHFRDRVWPVSVPRRLKENSHRVSVALEQLTSDLGRSPTVPELAGAAELDEEQVVEALEVGRAYTTRSLSVRSESDEGDFPETDQLEVLGSEDRAYEVAEDRAVLAAGLEELDERERRIIHLRFFEGLTQSQIAVEIGISQMHVSRLIRKALEILGGKIDVEEV
jgi:RNA polymerase sigma-B factor